MSEKKMVRRSVVIALGLICIILVVGLVGAVAIYTPLINDKDSKISSQASQISSLQTDYQNYKLSHSHSDSEYNSLQSTYDDYKSSHSHSDSDYNLLQSMATLGEQQTILNQYTINQGANTHTYVTGFQAICAGYLHISLTSTTSNANVAVEYWFKGQLFSVTKTIGTSGEAYFILMPTSIAVYVGNTNLVNGATHTITATYYY